MTDEEMRGILQKAKTVAVVGISDNPERPSYGVAKFLKNHGYRIIPVNPTVEQVLDERSIAGLQDVGEPVDVVDIFRRSEAVPPIIEDAIKIGAKVVWMQEGIVNEEAARRAREAGLQVVMDHCMKKEYKRLLGSKDEAALKAG
jgi:predicted CoA-binding protein